MPSRRFCRVVETRWAVPRLALHERRALRRLVEEDEGAGVLQGSSCPSFTAFINNLIELLPLNWAPNIGHHRI